MFSVDSDTLLLLRDEIVLRLYITLCVSLVEIKRLILESCWKHLLLE